MEISPGRLVQGALWPSFAEKLNFWRGFSDYDGWKGFVAVWRALDEKFGYEDFGGEQMAGKVKGKTDWKWVGYVDHKLTQGEKAQLEKWDCVDAAVFDLLADVVGEGYRFNFQFDTKKTVFVVSFTGVDSLPEHRGYTLTAYGKHWYDAIRALLFKHCVLFSEGWPVSGQSSDDDDYVG